MGSLPTSDAAQHRPRSAPSIGKVGPLLPFIKDASAAVQLHQNGPSSIVQHLRTVEVGSADQAAG